jgi:hypothetical protein
MWIDPSLAEIYSSETGVLARGVEQVVDYLPHKQVLWKKPKKKKERYSYAKFCVETHTLRAGEVA